MTRMTRTILIIFALWLCILVAFAFPTGAHAHMWYPKDCCDNRDCRQVELIKVDRSGYHFQEPKSFGGGVTVIPHHNFTKDNTRKSPDGEWHICTNQDEGSEMKDLVLCIFEPQQNLS